MDGLKVFIGGDATALKKTLREADYAIKGFVNQNKHALKNLENLGAPAAIAFTGLTLSIGAAAKKFGDFEATLNRVQAVSNASASEMAALKVKAEELGAATKFSGQEAASGMEELAKAGFNAKQTMDAIPGVLQLAAAGGVSVAQAAELAGGTIRGFGLAMDEAGRVADVMAQAANQSSVDIGDLQLTMKYVAPVASSASQSLEEMSGAIAIMGNSMIKGEQAGTTLRAALTRLQDPPKEAGEQLSALGIAIADTQGRMLPLGDIVDQLRTKTAKMTEVQRNAAIAQIFGTEALSGMLTLVKASPAEYQAMVDSMRNADGAAKKMSDTINSGFNGAMDQLGASADSAAKAVGENLAPAILALAGGIKGAVDAFNGMPAELKTLAVGAAAGGTALLGMAAAAGLLLPVIANLRAALFLTNTLALTPVGIAITALAATVTIATIAFKAYSDSVAAAKQKEDGARDARIKSTAAVKAQKDELEKLAKEYHNLAGKSKLSKDEMERLKAIQDKLAKEYPAIAEVIAKGATSHDKVEAAVRREIAAKADLLKMDQVAAQQRVMSDSTQLANERRKLDELQQRLEDAKSAPSYGDSAGKVQELNVISGMIAAQQRAVDAVNARVLASAADLQRVNGIVIPKPTVAKPNRGDAYSGGGGEGKSGKNEAEKAAEEAHRKAEERIQKLTQHYADLTERQKAWGYGDSVVIKNLQSLYAAVAKELGKTTAGAEALANIQQRITVLAGNNAVAKQAKEAADAKENERQALGNIMATVERQMAQEDKAAQKRKQDAEDAVRAQEDFNAAVRDMQGELVGLATDPSLERIANFAKGLAQDGKKAKEWGDAINKVGDDFKSAGDGAKGFEAALSSIGMSIDPVSLGLTMAISLANTLKEAFDKARAAQGMMFDSVRSVAREIKRAQVEASGDPVQHAELERQDAVDALNERAAAELKKRKEALKAENVVANAFSNGATYARIDSMTEADFPDIQEMLTAGMVGIDETYHKAVFSLVDTTTEGASKLQDETQKLIDETNKKIEESAIRSAEIVDELAAGGRDSWGNRISLEAERDLRIQEATADLEEKKAQAAKKQRDLYKEIRQINEDERAAIAGIENEGIAVRAKSEAQDKAERISKIKAEAQANRDAKTAEINGISEQIKKEEEAHDKAVSNVRILADERIKALGGELTRLKEITKEMERQAALAGQKAAAPTSSGGSSSTAAVSGSKSSSNNTTGEKYGDTSGARYDSSGRKVAYTKNGVNYYHTGGSPRLKSDEVPAILRTNEFVFTPQQFNGLMDLRTAAVNARGGGFSTGDIHITVNAARGMNERQVADAVWDNISTRLRRSGLGR